MPQLSQPMPKLDDGRSPVITSSFIDHINRTPPSNDAGVDMMYRRGFFKEEFTFKIRTGGFIREEKVFHPQPGIPRKRQSSRNFEVPPGTPALAFAAGTVRSVDATERGFAIKIDHGEELRTTYRHLRLPQVEVGQVIGVATPIATVSFDPTDPNEVPHLHFAMFFQGKRIDPGFLLATVPAVKAGDAPIDVADQDLLKALDKSQGDDFGIWLLILGALFLLSEGKRR